MKGILSESGARYVWERWEIDSKVETEVEAEVEADAEAHTETDVMLTVQTKRIWNEWKTKYGNREHNHNQNNNKSETNVGHNGWLSCEKWRQKKTKSQQISLIGDITIATVVYEFAYYP